MIHERAMLPIMLKKQAQESQIIASSLEQLKAVRPLRIVDVRREVGARRFEAVGAVDNVTYENAGAYFLGTDIRMKLSSGAALNMVRDFLADVTDEYHHVINTALREESLLESGRRRAFVYRLIQACRLGLKGLD